MKGVDVLVRWGNGGFGLTGWGWFALFMALVWWRND